MIALDLAAGNHPILLKLHQRDGGWRFAVRVVDETLRAPSSAWLALPAAMSATVATTRHRSGVREDMPTCARRCLFPP